MAENLPFRSKKNRKQKKNLSDRPDDFKYEYTSSEDQENLEKTFKECSSISGFIRNKDMPKALTKLGFTVTEAQHCGFLVMKMKGQNGLGKEEFFAYIKSLPKFFTTEFDIKLAFNAFDLNGDGYITMEEIAHVGKYLTKELNIDADMMKNFLEFADNDSNGTISYEEFRSMYLGLKL